MSKKEANIKSFSRFKKVIPVVVICAVLSISRLSAEEIKLSTIIPAGAGQPNIYSVYDSSVTTNYVTSTYTLVPNMSISQSFTPGTMFILFNAYIRLTTISQITIYVQVTDSASNTTIVNSGTFTPTGSPVSYTVSLPGAYSIPTTGVYTIGVYWQGISGSTPVDPSNGVRRTLTVIKGI